MSLELIHRPWQIRAIIDLVMVQPVHRIHTRPFGSRWELLAIAIFGLFTGCAETAKHDENLAGKRALEFAQAALVEKNFARGYDAMAPGGKRRISGEKLAETLKRMHPRAFPTKVTANEYQAMPGEPAIWIFLTGRNQDEQFTYRITMEGTAAGDYKVLTIDSGGVGQLFSPLAEKRRYPSPMSTPG